MKHRALISINLVLVLLVSFGAVSSGQAPAPKPAEPVVSGKQQVFPITQDDLKFAQELVEKGYSWLAVDLLEQLRKVPAIPDDMKLEASRGLLDAYRALVQEVEDERDREHYLQLAADLVKDLVKAYPEGKVPAWVLLEEAVVFQTDGRSRAVDILPNMPEAERAARVKQSEELLDKSIALFVTVQKLVKAEEDPLKNDPEKNEKRLEELASLRTKAALKLCWSYRFKALLYAEGSPERTSRMTEAVTMFGKFIDAYGDDMGVLNALYGRGTCYHDQGEKDKALDDFKQVMELSTQIAPPVPAEVLGLNTECAIQAAQILREQGKLEEAQKLIDGLLGAKIAPGDPNGQKLAIEKAAALAAGAKATKEKDPAAAKILVSEAVKLLRDVVLAGGVNSRAAAEAFAQIIKDNPDMVELGPVGKLIQGEVYLIAKQYKEAIEALKEAVDAPGELDGVPIALKAMIELGQAYRTIRDYETSLQTFDAIPAKFPKSDQLPKVALERCRTLADWVRTGGGQQANERYMQALKDLAAKYPDSEEGRDASYYLGGALRKQGRYTEAADAFAKVPDTSQYYGKSRFLRGLSMYNLFKAERKRSNIVNRDAMLAAEKEFTWAITEGRPALTDTWHVDSAATLCDLYYETSRFQQVLDTVKLFTERYPVAAKESASLLFSRMRALSALNRLDEAAAELDSLAEQKGDPEILLRGYLTLTDAYMKKADTVAPGDGGDRVQAQALREQARVTLNKALPLIPAENFDLWLWVAGKLWALDDTQGALNAAVNAEKAYPAGQPASPKLWNLRLLRLRCIDMLNRWDADAEKLLEQLEQNYPNIADIKMKRAAYLQKYKKDYPAALVIWNNVVAGLTPGTPNWVEAQYNRAVCYHETGDNARALDIIKVLEGMTEGLTKNVAPDMKRQIDELKATLK